MAKKDPAFLFYDGDAARDVSHMNRIERGCYFDLVMAQKKFGGFTVELIRKILGKDFEECWPSLELILKKEGDTYFIEWVRDSMEDRKVFAEKNRKRIQDWWDKKKTEENNSTDIPRNNNGITTDIPYEDENEDAIENEDVKENKGGVGEIEVSPTFEEFWNEYDKKVGEKGKIKKKWLSLSLKEREAIMDYIPNYKLSEPRKKYRKNPETFLNNKSWNDELIFENGEQTTKTGKLAESLQRGFAEVDRMFNQGGQTGTG